MEISLNKIENPKLNLINQKELNTSDNSNQNEILNQNGVLVNQNQNLLDKIQDTLKANEIKDKLNELVNELKSKFNEIKDEIKDKMDLKNFKEMDLKKIGLGLLGLVLGGALAYATFNLALYPISFVIQLLVSSGLPIQIPQNILNLLQTVFGLSILGAQYGSVVSGSISGAKTLANIDTNKNDKINLDTQNIKDKDIQMLLNQKIKESLEKFKNSDSLVDYIRNGFNVGVNVSQKISSSSGGITGGLIGLGLGLALMSPLALFIASLLVGKIGLWGSLAAGLVVSLPLGYKVFNALKEFSKNVFSLIGGAIGGAVGAGVGLIGKVVSSIKGLFNKKDSEDQTKDEFTSNSPYKNEGIEKLADSFGKTTSSFVNGVSDFAALSSVITELLSKEPNGLQFIGKLVAGTIKSYEGTAILKSAALENKPELKNVGLFKFLTGFSLLASFLGPLFGPIGVAAFAVLPLVFMALEKVFEAKATLIKNNNSNDSVEDRQEKLKSSYAMGVAGQTFIDSLGSLGKFWMGWDTIFGGNYGGLTSIFGIVGATKDVIDGAKMMSLSDDRSSLELAFMGLLNIVGGACLFLAAIGLGRVFGLVSLGISIFKLVHQIMSLLKSNKNSNKDSKETLKTDTNKEIINKNNEANNEVGSNVSNNLSFATA